MNMETISWVITRLSAFPSLLTNHCVSISLCLSVTSLTLICYFCLYHIKSETLLYCACTNWWRRCCVPFVVFFSQGFAGSTWSRKKKLPLKRLFKLRKLTWPCVFHFFPTRLCYFNMEQKTNCHSRGYLNNLRKLTSIILFPDRLPKKELANAIRTCRLYPLS